VPHGAVPPAYTPSRLNGVYAGVNGTLAEADAAARAKRLELHTTMPPIG
jgi:hypothetical protein